MGDEDVGKLILFLQLIQKLQNLGLNGHVQGRNRLVADNQLGIDGQGPGDADSLPLAAGKLIGIPGHIVPGQVDRLQQIPDFLDTVLLVLHAEFDQRVLQGAENGKRGVQ